MKRSPHDDDESATWCHCRLVADSARRGGEVWRALSTYTRWWWWRCCSSVGVRGAKAHREITHRLAPRRETHGLRNNYPVFFPLWLQISSCTMYKLYIYENGARIVYLYRLVVVAAGFLSSSRRAVFLKMVPSDISRDSWCAPAGPKPSFD